MGRRAQAQLRALARLGGRTEKPEQLADPEDRMVVLAALSSLSSRQRAAIVLRYYEDLPDEEIAQVIGTSRSTVRSLIHRAIPELRKQIGAGRDEPSVHDADRKAD